MVLPRSFGASARLLAHRLVWVRARRTRRRQGVGGPPWEVLQLLRSEPRHRPLFPRTAASTAVNSDIARAPARCRSWLVLQLRPSAFHTLVARDVPRLRLLHPRFAWSSRPLGGPPPLRAEAHVPSQREAADASLSSGSLSLSSTASGSSVFGDTPSPPGSLRLGHLVGATRYHYRSAILLGVCSSSYVSSRAPPRSPTTRSPSRGHWSQWSPVRARSLPLCEKLDLVMGVDHLW
jgi:hypothetical protein